MCSYLLWNAATRWQLWAVCYTFLVDFFFFLLVECARGFESWGGRVDSDGNHDLDGYLSFYALGLDPVVLWRNTRSIPHAFCLIRGPTLWCCISSFPSLSITWEAWQHWSKLDRLWCDMSAACWANSVHRTFLLTLSDTWSCWCVWELPKTLLYTEICVAPVGEFQMTLYFRSSNY